jgi:diguanylate cyclase (GGDEF)-like protein/PAS domain S-box-containing protein
LREFARNLREGIYITTVGGDILDCNPAFLEMFGIQSLSELQGLTAFDLHADPSRRTELLAKLDRENSVREFEFSIRRPDGEMRTVLDTCYLIRDDTTGEAFLHGILVDITTRKSLEAQLLELSTHDPLTGALNRRYLLSVDEAFAREPELRCGCVFVDIDHFKVYNDEYGHRAGDEILVRMSRFLMRHVRAEEAVIRLGGDEFAVLLRDADAEGTQLVAERLRAEALTTGPVPFSLGWAAREPGETVSRLLDRADRGLLEVRVNRRHSDPRQQLVVQDPG